MTIHSASSSAEITLLQKWKLVRAATRDRGLSGSDLGVLVEIVERFRDDFGNGRASHGHLARVVALSPRAVFDSLARLVEKGYIRVLRSAAGPRPTEYLPVWERGAEVAADCNIAVPINDGDLAAPFDEPLSHSAMMEPLSSNCAATQYLLPVPPIKGGDEVELSPGSPPYPAPVGGGPAGPGEFAAVEILSVTPETIDGDDCLLMSTRTAGGLESEIVVVWQSADETVQRDGQAELASLKVAANIETLIDGSELVGLFVREELVRDGPDSWHREFRNADVSYS